MTRRATTEVGVRDVDFDSFYRREQPQMVALALALTGQADVACDLAQETMVKAFEIAGYGEDTVVERFGGMYRAFQYGAPPHGGMAAGVDRVIMLLAGEQNLREVALFPMNQRAEDILMGAPSEATNKQLRELHVRVNPPEK